MQQRCDELEGALPFRVRQARWSCECGSATGCDCVPTGIEREAERTAPKRRRPSPPFEVFLEHLETSLAWTRVFILAPLESALWAAHTPTFG